MYATKPKNVPKLPSLLEFKEVLGLLTKSKISLQ